ncbi:MAG: DUF3822 family protein [Breznakibacter sp.]
MTKHISGSSFADEAFDPTLSQSYYLSIRVATDGVSFCILDPVRNLFITFGYHPLEIKNGNWAELWYILETEPLFELEYQKVIVLYEEKYSVLVPGMLYRADRTAEILNFTFSSGLENAIYMENRIKLADAVNIFAIPKQLADRFRNQFGDVHFLHATTPLLESNMIDGLPVNGQSTIRLHFEKNRFYILVLERRNLKLFNQFDISSPNDMIYFLLFAIDQLQLSTNDILLLLSGTIERDGEYQQMLKNYFKKVRFEKIDRHVNFSHALRDVDYPRHFQLFNFSLCV